MPTPFLIQQIYLRLPLLFRIWGENVIHVEKDQGSTVLQSLAVSGDEWGKELIGFIIKQGFNFFIGNVRTEGTKEVA